jgi:protein-disulfide isomerase
MSRLREEQTTAMSRLREEQKPRGDRVGGMRWLRVAAVVGVMLLAAGCAKAIDGAAVPPPGTHPTAAVMLADDGFGIQLGRPVAPVALEIFIEPQCPHCAAMMMFHGGEIADYIVSGDLRVTYRPVTFLDTPPQAGAIPTAAGYSHRVSNALFLAAADEGLPAAGFQNFVEELYWQADPSRDDRYLANVGEIARLPQQLIDRIGAGTPAVDTVTMDQANEKRLNEILHVVATPTVYDLKKQQVIDTSGNEWLKRLVGHR